jgi:threonine aldolase
MINLVSDTITTPTPAMLEAMWSAQVKGTISTEVPIGYQAYKNRIND